MFESIPGPRSGVSTRAGCITGWLVSSLTEGGRSPKPPSMVTPAMGCSPEAPSKPGVFDELLSMVGRKLREVAENVIDTASEAVNQTVREGRAEAGGCRDRNSRRSAVIDGARQPLSGWLCRMTMGGDSHEVRLDFSWWFWERLGLGFAELGDRGKKAATPTGVSTNVVRADPVCDPASHERD